MGSTLGPAPDPVAVFRAHRCAITALSFHPPSGYLLSGDADGQLKIWDTVRRRLLSSARVHSPSSGVIGIGASSSIESNILSQGRDGTVKYWQLINSGLSRQPLLSLKTESYHFCKLSVPKVKARADQPRLAPLAKDNGSDSPARPDGGATLPIVIVGQDPAVVEIWDVRGGTRLEQLHLPKRDDSRGISSTTKSAGMCMSLSAYQSESDHLNVISGYEDGSMAVWDLRNSKAPLALTKFHSEPVLSIGMDSSFKGGVSGAADNKLIFFSLHNDEGLRLRKEIDLHKPGVADISVRHDDKIFATAGWDYRVRVFDYHRRRPLAILKYHASAVNSVVFSDDGKLLASASNDATIALWSVYPPQ